MAKGKGFGGFGGGMNMQAMMKQAQKMQESMLKAQEEIAHWICVQALPWWWLL